MFQIFASSVLEIYPTCWICCTHSCDFRAFKCVWVCLCLESEPQYAPICHLLAPPLSLMFILFLKVSWSPCEKSLKEINEWQVGGGAAALVFNLLAVLFNQKAAGWMPIVPPPHSSPFISARCQTHALLARTIVLLGQTAFQQTSFSFLFF